MISITNLNSGLLLTPLLAAWISVSGAAISATDDRGVPVTLDRPASRIISLAPHITELLFAAGAGEQVIGALRFSDYPAAARSIPRVGDIAHLDLERILVLKPDLVVGWLSGNRTDDISRIEQLGMRVYVMEIRRFTDIPGHISRLAELAGTASSAAPVIARFRQRLILLQDRYRERRRVRVFYQISERPLYTVNREHIINEALELCGGENLFAPLETLAPAVSLEAVVAADPEVIIAGASVARAPTALQGWQQWPAMTAVKNHNLFSVEPDLLHRPGPRILDGVEQVCTALEQSRHRLP